MRSQALGIAVCVMRRSQPLSSISGCLHFARAILAADQIDQMEPYFPLHVLVCSNCFLVQLQEYVKPEHIFTEYAYFSSYSTSWVEHARRYCEMIAARLHLGPKSRVYEIASNDGYLLQHFLPLGIPVIGIEPAANVAAVAQQKNIPTLVDFFGLRLAQRLVAEGRPADLIIGNNVLAQVPDLNDFTAGMAHLLAPNGVITLEFPHLERLIDENQFDTIYHEHFSYFSLVTIDRLATKHGLKVFDVEHLSTHGGSLRVYLCRADARARDVCRASVPSSRTNARLGLSNIEYYSRFSAKVHRTKRQLLSFLIQCKEQGAKTLRLWRTRQGKHLAQLLRHWNRLSRLHRRSQSLQARSLYAGNAHSNLSGFRHRRGAA